MSFARPSHEHALPDQARSFTLDDEWTASWCVTADGSAWPWLVRNGADSPPGCNCRDCAPHEQRGKLPDAFHPLRCRRPCRDGQPCRLIVTRPGTACHHHRDREDAP